VLLPPAELLERFPDDREAVARSGELAQRLEFDLTEELGYRYPDFSDGDVPAIVQLRALCDRLFRERYASLNGLKKRARQRLDDELALIERIGLAGFFLLHWEVLELAREVAVEVRGGSVARQVLPPGRGRGSSVGSIVCYLTGLSHVDPVAADLSLGRFLNDELSSVPDIDLDFPRDIREQLIVRVTEKYGREHAALVATFATYRSRGAIRDVGKRSACRTRPRAASHGSPTAGTRRASATSSPRCRTRDEAPLAALARVRRAVLEIAGLPRHISQHPAAWSSRRGR
jgi:error-prone DNA polymerase